MENGGKEELWIEKIAGFTHLEKLGKKIGYEDLGPYLYLWVFSFLNLVILEYLISYQGDLRPSPLSVLGYGIPAVVGFSFAIWAARKVRDELHEGIKGLNFNLKSEIFKSKIILYVIGGLIMGIWIIVQAGILPNPSTGKYVSQAVFSFTVPEIMRYLIWIFVLLLTCVEAGAYYIGVNILLPWKIEKRHFNPSDVRRFGGMKKVGNLILRTSQLYFAGLIVITIANYLAFVPIFERIGIMLFSFVIAWSLGVCLFIFPAFWIHLKMKEGKEDLLNDLEEKIQKTGKDSGGRLEVEPKSRDETIEYIFNYLEHEHIHAMSEYPIDADIIQQLVFSAVIPIFIQIFILLF